MLTDIWASIKEFVSEYYVVGLVIWFILVMVFEAAQYVINSSLEEDLIDLTERVEAIENELGIVVNEDCEKEEK